MRYQNSLIALLLSAWCTFNTEAARSNSTSKEMAKLFISEMYPNQIPKQGALWINDELRAQLTNILGHEPKTLRIKYRQNSNQSLWIFDEIGKVKPITIGVFIRAGKIDNIRVLKFRESRGWEIKYSFFTDQYRDTSLTVTHHLNQNIDGITGATLSVNAMTRVARAALLLHQVLTRKLENKLQQEVAQIPLVDGVVRHGPVHQSAR